MEKFTDRLMDKVLPIWKKNNAHPFVQGIGYGTLDPQKFKFFMIQDYLYLIEYAKIFALGAYKARDVDMMLKFATLLESTLNVEMGLHREYCKKFGISDEDLENAEHSPTTYAYTHYMLHVSINGSLAELVASLLPCMWGYWEIGRELSLIEGALENENYGEWVQMYSSREFEELTLWCIDLMNELAADLSERELENLEKIFLNTTRFEYLFWDMAYYEQMWP